MLAYGKRRLFTTGGSVPQNRSITNAQDTHTGPDAGIPSDICNNACSVTGHVGRRFGVY